MLFPAVHRLGFQAGQAVFNFLYNIDAAMDKNNISGATVLEFLTDTELLLESLRYGIRCVLRFPGLYKTWWWNLVAKDPLHVAIETIMLLSVVYMMLSRSTEGYKDSSKDKLSLREQEDLLWEWKHKTRTPLAPSLKQNNKNSESNSTKENSEDDDDYQIVVQKQEGKWLTVTVPQHWIVTSEAQNNEMHVLTENKRKRC